MPEVRQRKKQWVSFVQFITRNVKTLAIITIGAPTVAANETTTIRVNKKYAKTGYR